MKLVSETGATCTGALVGGLTFLLAPEHDRLVSYGVLSILIACLAIAIAGMLNRALSQGSSGSFGEWEISTLLPIVRDTRSSTVRRATAALAISMALLCGSVCGFWGGFILLFMFSKG